MESFEDESTYMLITEINVHVFILKTLLIIIIKKGMSTTSPSTIYKSK